MQYQTLIEYLTLNYSDEIEEIMENISNIDEEKIDRILKYYKDDIPIDRINMAREIILRRAKWMSEYYYKNRNESRGSRR